MTMQLHNTPNSLWEGVSDAEHVHAVLFSWQTLHHLEDGMEKPCLALCVVIRVHVGTHFLIARTIWRAQRIHQNASHVRADNRTKAPGNEFSGTITAHKRFPTGWESNKTIKREVGSICVQPSQNGRRSIKPSLREARKVCKAVDCLFGTGSRVRLTQHVIQTEGAARDQPEQTALIRDTKHHISSGNERLPLWSLPMELGLISN